MYTDNSVFAEDWARREEWEAIAHDQENAGGHANASGQLVITHADRFRGVDEVISHDNRRLT